MRRRIGTRQWCSIAALLMGTLPVMAQTPADLPPFPSRLEHHLTAEAANAREITIDRNMLNLAAQLFGRRSAEDQERRHLIDKLDSITIRKYDFAGPGEYSAEDVNAIRGLLFGPEWRPMVQQHSMKDGVDNYVWIRMLDGRVEGVRILRAEPTSLKVIAVAGDIVPDKLYELGGMFGLPAIKPEGAP